MSSTAPARELRTPWRHIVKLAAMSTLAIALVVLVDVSRTGAHPANLLQGGTEGPAFALLQQDFPDVEFPSGLGLDGQQYYAMARSPIHIDDAASSLDRPVYRWQRPLLPWLARVVHPSGGGGSGLIMAFFAVGFAALLLGGVAAGALSTALGGRTWPAAVFPLLPGAYMSLRVTMADSLALALVLAALALATHRRVALAMAVAALAVLARETSVLVFIGWAIARRTRRDALIAIAPALVGGSWALWLRMSLPSGPDEKVDELGVPFVGILRAARDHWFDGSNKLGFGAAAAAFVVAAIALHRAPRQHPLMPAMVLNLALVSMMNHSVVGIDFGATRSTMPVLMIGLLILATAQRRVDAAAPEQGATGIVGPGLVSGTPSKR